ncbi:MAG: OmpA family protein [Vicinamibacterales bacterium]
MKRLLGVVTLGTLVAATPALAQTTGTQAGAAESRPATTTVNGDTGLWFVPTAEVLRDRNWSVSFFRQNHDYGQGFTDVTHFPITGAVGIRNRVEVFGSMEVITRIDRDTRPIFFVPLGTTPDTSNGGVVNEYPLVREGWIGNRIGDLRLGLKWNVVSEADNKAAALALRAGVKVPTGDDERGASTGKVDYYGDLIVSKKVGVFEVAGYGGMIVRGNPDGFDLSNGLRYGGGAAFPATSALRFTLEWYGERYFDSTITAPANFLGIDGSTAPTSTPNASPLWGAFGATWQRSNGFFLGAGVNWSVATSDRADARYCITGTSACPSAFAASVGDRLGVQVRLGYHPGARKYVAPPPPQPPAKPADPTPPPANRPPTVRAACDPCTVEVGRVSTVTADAQDPDGDPLTYRWTANTGSFTSATNRQTPWTAPNTVGTVPVTVTVTDSRGASATASVNIQVVQPAIRDFVFEDVHFEFDRYNLRADALRVLDEAVTAMQANATLRLQIEGHTCNIGTAEYNLALGERRAAAVRDYLTSRGISADRLSVVSFGEERPKFDNSREETRRMNRRAAMVVRLQ